MDIKKIQFPYGKHTVTLETGRIARQATAAVFASMDDTQVLVSVVANKNAKPGQDFFPLGVHYIEKTYAAGKIPGGFLKREARPTEKETLTSRLIDRPIRPLFADGFMNEVQVVITVMSANKEVDPDIIAMIGTSAALSIIGLPFNGPIGAARVAYVDEQYVLNPTYSALEDSALNMVVAGTKSAVLMVESEAQELSEQVMLDAVMFGHEQMQTVIDHIEKFAESVGSESWQWQAPATNESLLEALQTQFSGAIADAYQITDKKQRQTQLSDLKAQAVDALVSNDDPDNNISESDVLDLFKAQEKKIVRQRVLDDQPRIDGRDHKTVRPLTMETGLIANAHGSAIFTRGETQAIVVTTLGSKRDAQLIETLERMERVEDHFLFHYNFPPYCVGETGMVGAPKRREIGHGRLARRGITACLPTLSEYPFTIRVVSEITESNGSSSMASVCGSSLALMDAGVPLKRPVAGIAMGLIKDDDRFTVLTDILGDEDHLGDMDFKVAGTTLGVNALQMDIKIEGITKEIMSVALKQAKQARAHILGEMNKVICQPNTAAKNAPKTETIQIAKDKIRDLIGKGGETIKGIISQSGANIDVDDQGLVNVFANDQESFDKAIDLVKAVVAVPEVGKVYLGTVSKVVDFGAFVTVLPNQDGLLHVSEIANERVEDISLYFKEGDEIEVKVLAVDDRGRVKLSRKVLLNDNE